MALLETASVASLRAVSAHRVPAAQALPCVPQPRLHKLGEGVMASFDNQGWLDAATKYHGPGNKQGGLRSSTIGIVMHSAVGSWPSMKGTLDGSARNVSWHFSNLHDGRLFQHYPVA